LENPHPNQKTVTTKQNNTTTNQRFATFLQLQNTTPNIKQTYKPHQQRAL